MSLSTKILLAAAVPLLVLGILLIAVFAVEAALGGNWIGLAIRCWAIFELFKGMLIAHQIQKSLG